MKKGLFAIGVLDVALGIGFICGVFEPNIINASIGWIALGMTYILESIGEEYKN